MYLYVFVCFRRTVNEVGRGRTSVCPAALLCRGSGFLQLIPAKREFGFARPPALLLLGARGRGIEVPVRAVTTGPLAQAEKPRLAQQVTGN